MTACEAVAVSAKMHRGLIFVLATSPTFRKAGLKLCDHWLTQWASSTTSNEHSTDSKHLCNALVPSRSGETKTTLARPFSTSSKAWTRCLNVAPCLPDNATAGNSGGKRDNCSSMSATKGETTTTTPFTKQAGSW
jgi:hypothetical protein